MEKLRKDLEKWLAHDGNSPAKLAALLGYSSSNTIQGWRRGTSKIPGYKAKEVARICRNS